MLLNETPSSDLQRDEEIFSQALQELKDLRSQLHYAARYCESAFLENKGKRRMVLESTKSYVREAIVAVVDHLGNVSSKLEEKILDDSEIVETEQKMVCLKQRLLTCQQYSVTIEVSSLRWSINWPRHHHYYALPCPLISLDEKTSELPRNETSDLDAPESPEMIGQFILAVHLPVTNDVAAVVATDSPTKLDAVLANAVQVLGNPSLSLKPCHTVFASKYEDNYLVEIDKKKKKNKPMRANKFLSYLRISRMRT